MTEFRGILARRREISTLAEILRNADRRFRAASPIKVPIMTAAYEQAARGRLPPDSRITLRGARL